MLKRATKALFQRRTENKEVPLPHFL